MVEESDKSHKIFDEHSYEIDFTIPGITVLVPIVKFRGPLSGLEVLSNSNPDSK